MAKLLDLNVVEYFDNNRISSVYLKTEKHIIFVRVGSEITLDAHVVKFNFSHSLS